MASPIPSPAQPSSPANRWGELTDSKGDCKAAWAGDSVTLAVPGTPHNLNKTVSDIDAPRILVEVDGDFAVEVRVTAELKPTLPSTVDGAPFHGAGLLLWASEDLFVRLERNAWVSPVGDIVCLPPLFELMRNGKQVSAGGVVSSVSFFSGPATWLRLERKGDVLTSYLCHDDKIWTQCGQLTVSLPKKVQIGVAAVNTSKKPFTARFDGFRLYK
jgi:regulation of enolase protein 1 (concanavalin A-like superfamily)